MSRSSEYTDAIAEAICERLAEGESLRTICADEAMPARRTVFGWLSDERYAKFAERYTRAREEQADALAEEIVDIADEQCTTIRGAEGEATEVVFDATAVARNRLRVDARKWVASKLKPKKYGDKIDLNVDARVRGTVSYRANIPPRKPPTE